MPQTQDEKYTLNLIGKYGTLAELLKRGLSATLPRGRYKNIELTYADGSTASVIVKVSRTNKFVTNYYQARFHDPNKKHPDYWVIVHIDDNNVSHYYVFTHDEIGAVQTKRDGHPPKIPSRGCENVLLHMITDYENKWETILNHR